MAIYVYYTVLKLELQKNSCQIKGERQQFRIRVFRNEYFESLWVPPARLGYPRAPGRVRVVDGQVGQVRLEFWNPCFRTIFFEILAFKIVGRFQIERKAYKYFKQDIAIEKSPSYFVTEIAPERVHAMNKSILLLLIVRDPVSYQRSRERL